jgi:hypothetical protein
MPNTIRIKRSTGSTAPASLANAELAYSEGSGQLWIGVGTGGFAGTASSIVPIGGVGSYLAISNSAIQTAAGQYTFTGNCTFSGTVGMGVVTATAPSAADNSARVPTTAWVRTYADAAFLPIAGGTVSGNLTVGGNLTVNGSTTTINSTIVSVDDINIVLGDTGSPSDATANGGGITLRGTTDKTLSWSSSANAWTSSEDFSLATGKEYEINGVSVLSATALGSSVTSSSLTSVGTITSGTWSATTIAVARGGTGLTSAVNGLLKGNGTSYSAATAGTDYLSPDSAIDGGTY